MSEIKVQVKRLPAMRVAYVSIKSASPEGEAINKITTWARSKGIKQGYRLFGYDNCQPHPNHIYTTWLTVGAGVEASGGIGVKDVPGGLYAVTRVTGVGNIAPTWKQLLNWAQAQGHRISDQPCLEESVSLPDTPEGQMQLDLYLALAE